MQPQQGNSCSKRIETWFINLTNSLLKNYKINNITYLVVKILQYLQYVYFVMRVQNSYHWNFSFISYFSLYVNYTSVDSLLKTSPAIFAPLLYLIITILIVIIALGVSIGLYSGWSEKLPWVIKFLIPVINLMILFLRSIMVIPALQLIFICFNSSASSDLKLVMDSGLRLGLGTLLLISFLIVKLYILIFFRESNPFSDLQHAGETIYRGILVLAVKILFSIYSVLDLKGEYEGAANIIFVVVLIILILEGHYEVGMYKSFPKKLEFKLKYFALSIGFLQALDFYSPYEITSFSFLAPYFYILYCVSDWIIALKNKNAILVNLSENNSPQKLQEHVIYLIELIDQMEVRQNRIRLEGYMHIHRRECRIEHCPCQSLGLIQQRNQELVKMEYFKLVVIILSEGRRKFARYRNIDLLLGLIYHFRIKNPLQAIYAFTKLVSAHENSLINRLYVSFYLQRVEQQMVELDQKEVARTKDINKYLQYTNKMVVFEEHIESCTKHHVQFWKLMLDSNPQIKRLQDLGTQITRHKDFLKDEFETIFEENPNSIHLLKIYGKFLLQVTNQQSYNVKYLQKADIIQKNIKYASKIDETSTKYNQNAQTGVIVITGNEGELGNITHSNNLIKGLLGYKRSQLLKHNVDTIMPKIYADNHNSTLSRYIGASESKVNGHERIVPALNKEGFILPVTALTKALPTLTQGIQIVGLLAKLQEKFSEDDEIEREVDYILYRADNEQIMGISEGCSKTYHIDPCLIYGNPNNMNNELKIKHLFGVSFERGDQGRIAAALEVGEVEAILNSKGLKDQFIISKNSSEQKLIDVEEEYDDHQGVQAEVVVHNILCSLYYGVTLKLIAIYQKKNANHEKILQTVGTILKKKRQESKHQKTIEENNKNDSEDYKDLKDFKNFISLKNQPSAITALSTICLVFIALIVGSIIGLIVNWYILMAINQNTMLLTKYTLLTELATPQVMTQTQNQIMALSANTWNITTFTSYFQAKKRFTLILTALKNWQFSILPYKYSFQPNYNDKTIQYSLYSTNTIGQKSLFLQQLINDYISQLQSVSLTNISSLQNFSVNLKSNIYEKYESSKMNELFSLRRSLNASNGVIWNWYKREIGYKTNIIIIVSSGMIGGILLWLILLLPYILSVTKINNRVLSLFSLIPYDQICKLIHSCLQYLNSNLTQANVSLDDLKYYEVQQLSNHPRLNQLSFTSPHNLIQPDRISPLNSNSSLNKNSPSNLHSPSLLGLHDNSFTQSNILKRSSSGMGLIKGGIQNIGLVEQKFQKMINSQDRNKKIVILKFIAISLLILGFVLFYLFYSLSVLSQASKSISNFQTLGRRPALLRNAKLLITEYLINPLYSPLANASSIKSLNLNLITQFYNLQANLLYLDLGTSQADFSNYNNGDICSLVSNYAAYAVFGDQLTQTQCYGIHSQILQKGIKTGIVDTLQTIRSLVSQYNSTVPRSVLVSNALVFTALTKYIQTPVMAILNSIYSNLTTKITESRSVILFSGIIFMLTLIFCWQFIWMRYLSQLNVKIWRTKGLLNLIPMRIITSNDLLKNEFRSGQLQNAVR